MKLSARVSRASCFLQLIQYMLAYVCRCQNSMLNTTTVATLLNVHRQQTCHVIAVNRQLKRWHKNRHQSMYTTGTHVASAYLKSKFQNRTTNSVQNPCRKNFTYNRKGNLPHHAACGNILDPIGTWGRASWVTVR